MKRAIAYIDGFNLYFGLRSAFDRKYLWLNPKSMVEKYIDSCTKLEKVKYFTSKIKPSAIDPDKHKRQQMYLDAIESCGIEMHFGQYILDNFICPGCNFKINKCPNCNRLVEKFNEKKTDVNIASEMIVDAFKDQYDVAFLVSGDRDLATPVEKISRMFHSKKIIILFPPNRRTVHMTKICYRFYDIDEKTLQTSLFPDKIEFEKSIKYKDVTIQKKLKITKPVSWV